MMDLSRIALRVAQGCLIDVRFLSNRGREENGTGDHPCMNADFRGDRFAYFPAFGSCAHAVHVTRVEEEGDEIFLHGSMGDMKVRVRVSPVWLDEDREALGEWRKEKDAGFIEQEFERVLE